MFYCDKCFEPRTTIILNTLGKYETIWDGPLITEEMSHGGVEIKCACGGRLLSTRHLDKIYDAKNLSS